MTEDGVGVVAVVEEESGDGAKEDRSRYLILIVVVGGCFIGARCGF